jgi:hypothetical protein
MSWASEKVREICSRPRTSPATSSDVERFVRAAVEETIKQAAQMCRTQYLSGKDTRDCDVIVESLLEDEPHRPGYMTEAPASGKRTPHGT